jgi:hypothetical protein
MAMTDLLSQFVSKWALGCGATNVIDRLLFTLCFVSGGADSISGLSAIVG